MRSRLNSFQTNSLTHRSIEDRQRYAILGNVAASDFPRATRQLSGFIWQSNESYIILYMNFKVANFMVIQPPVFDMSLMPFLFHSPPVDKAK